MVTIVVPVYNAEKTLTRCIGSVLRQTYSDWELILVDDGSTDSSLDISRQFAKDDSRIHVISKTNGGVSSARNQGLRSANGEYIAFLDSDDRLCEDALDVLIKNIEASQTDCVVCGIKQDDGKLWAPERRRSYSSIGDFRSDFLYHLSTELFSVCFNKLYRRSLINKFFNEQCSFGEDLMFVLDYLENCQTIEIIPDALYLHNNLNINSISHNINSKRLIDVENCQHKILKYYGSEDTAVFTKYINDISWWIYKLYLSDNCNKDKIGILSNWRKTTLLRDKHVRDLVKGTRNIIIIFNGLYVPVRVTSFFLRIFLAMKR